MIAALLFINHKGEIIISRTYRDNFNKEEADLFRTSVRGRWTRVCLDRAAPRLDRAAALASQPCGSRCHCHRSSLARRRGGTP